MASFDSAAFDAKFKPFAEKMASEGLGPSVIAAFQHSYKELLSGSTGNISEASIAPVESLLDLDADIKGAVQPDTSLLKHVVVVKLNGGLGTSMGLDKAKSLLTVKDDDTFLDLAAKQVISMRASFNSPVQFLLMNSFNTSADTLGFLGNKYASQLGSGGGAGRGAAAMAGIELMQNKVPKVEKASMAPATWAINSQLEWCPPGHGDLYTALYSSGKLDELLAAGIKYMFVSNSDNLGATLDLELLTHFASKEFTFMMECCRRTESDKKGGHLALRLADNQLILRESAQCAKSDEAQFQDTSRHRFFNTNNLWIRLDALKALMDSRGGFVPLPTIYNGKTVDPQQDTSTPVWQLETAMGAAIECFANSSAVCVSRKRFAPVKKCSDLLLLKSDAYTVDSNNVLVLNPAITSGVAPIVALDDKKYKLIQQLDLCTRYGTPSLVGCKKLTVKGEVWLSSGNVMRGEVNIVNNSDEPKLLPPGIYADCTVDLTPKDTAPGLGPLRPFTTATTPYTDQKPGTSGLRKKTAVFEKQRFYLHNFVQSTFNALGTVAIGGGAGGGGATTDIVHDGALVIGGDGRYFNSSAIQTIIKMAVANGVKRIVVGQNGLLSTPAISAIIRERGPVWQRAFGGFILTASHNPGGPTEDFGIKYNINNGGPAPDALTNEIYSVSKTLTSFKICDHMPDIDISKVGEVTISPTEVKCRYTSLDVHGNPTVNNSVTSLLSRQQQAAANPAEIKADPVVTVQIVSSTDTYMGLMRSVFDFPSIKRLVQRPDFRMAYDCMYGVQGPYAHACFIEELGGRGKVDILHGTPSETFGGMHADPNLTYAREVCDVMGVDIKGNAIRSGAAATSAGAAAASGEELAGMIASNTTVPVLGVAADGDADRNMILGRHFFVTPSDSLAIIAAHANIIPYFAAQGGLRTVARSMPTSGAVDIVARHKNLHLFETPTGWKYFGNVMDSKAIFRAMNYGPVLCGEESFGTGSDHLREKDGLWAALTWLSILAHYNNDETKPFVHVRDIVVAHWATYGRNYYSRYDYEGVSTANANAVMSGMLDKIASKQLGAGVALGGGKFTLARAEEFSYRDPVDHSVARNQGIMLVFVDNSRIIFRLSGTAGSGATIRMYLEKYAAPSAELELEVATALRDIVAVALEVSEIAQITGMASPTVIT